MFSGFLLLPNFKRGKKNDKKFFNEEIITLIKVNDARHARFFTLGRRNCIFRN